MSTTHEPVARKRSRRSLLAGYVRFLADVGGWRAAGALGVVLTTGLLEGAGVLVLVPLLDLVGLDMGGAGGAGGIGRVLGWILSASGLPLTLPIVLTVFVGIAALQAVLVMTQALLNLRLEQRLTAHLRETATAAVLRADWLYLSRQKSAELARVLTTEVDRVGSITYQALSLAAASVHLLVGLAIAARISLPLTALASALGLMLLVGLRARVQTSRDLGERYAEESTRVYGLLTESLGHIRATKTLGAEERTARALAEGNREVLALWRRAVGSYMRSKAILDVASALTLAATIYAGVRAFAMAPGALLVLLLLFARLVPRVSSLQQSVQLLVHALPAFGLVERLLDSCAAHREPAQRAGPVFTLQREMALSRVSVEYDGTRLPALADISLRIPAGQITAILGPSGAGKTTLADVLLGLVRPTAGELHIDGRRLEAPDAISWRESVAYVSQESVLFHDSVRANLLWGCPGATDEAIWDALQAAGAAAFVRQLPDQLDTIAGDRGMLLSGGERQRLAIARALLRRPQLLVLDEPTSALDAEHEQVLLATLQRLRGSVTVVLITHRIAAARHADLLHVLDAGRLVESGTWTSLAASHDGRLRRLAELQGVPA